MSFRTDYRAHDIAYRRLKASGAPGWGVETFADRMAAWDTEIQQLVAHPAFPRPPAKLLEIGSGAGDVAHKFARLGFRVSGIEISPAAVEWAREKDTAERIGANFFMGDACDLGRFQDCEFQAVIDGNCLHFIIGEDRSVLLSEVRRVLAQGGFLYVSTMVGEPKLLEATQGFDPATRFQIRDGVAIRYMGRAEDVLGEIEKAGFTIFTSEVRDNPWWAHLHCLARKS